MYSEYKQVKAKVKLLEVLVAKHRSRAYTSERAPDASGLLLVNWPV